MNEFESAQHELRILQVFDSLGAGGAETWLLALLRYFRDHEHALGRRIRTDILLTGGEPALFDSEAKELGARLIYLRYSRHDLARFARQFRRILREGNYHAIHNHQDYAAGIHFLLGLGRLPHVRIAHVHNPIYQLVERRRDRLTRLRQTLGKRLVWTLASVIAGTSLQLLREYGFQPTSNPGAKVRALYCGFDVTKFASDADTCRKRLLSELGWSEESRIVLFVGRLGGDELASTGPSHKNPVFALDVFAEASRRDSRLRMIFAGEKSVIYPLLKKRTEEAGLEDRVKYVGVRNDVPALMLGSDVLLFPSSAEGLGMVVVEAQASGLPVLASASTPRECVVIPEMVEFLSLEDGTVRWAERLLDTIAKPRAARTNCNARVGVSPFSIENSARQLVAKYSRDD